MNLSIKLFAVARQHIGRDSVEVTLPAVANVRQLRAAIVEQFPILADVIAHSRLAVNNDYASDEVKIPTDAQIALIPPVSGG